MEFELTPEEIFSLVMAQVKIDILLWVKRISAELNFEDITQDELDKGTRKIEECNIQWFHHSIEWINANRKTIEDAVIKGGILEAANDRTGKQCSVKDSDGVEILFPISEEYFKAGLYFYSIKCYAGEEIKFDVYMDTVPNYFDCINVIQLYFTFDKSGNCRIEVNGLKFMQYISELFYNC